MAKRFPDPSPRVAGRTWGEVSPQLQQFLDKLVLVIAGLVNNPGDIAEEISNRISADNVLSNDISAVSNRLSNEISNRISADNVLSQQLSVHSQQLSEHSQKLSEHSQQLSLHSQQISVLSQAHSVLSQAHSVLSSLFSDLTSAHNALSNRVSANSGTGGGSGSVTSDEVSAVSAQAASALSQVRSVLSQAISAGDAGLSVRIDTQSQSISVLSQQVSVLSAAHSVISALLANLSARSVGDVSVHGLQSIINALSNRISANSGVGGGGGSVTSEELSQRISAIQTRQMMNVDGLAVSAGHVVYQAGGVNSAFFLAYNNADPAQRAMGMIIDPTISVSATGRVAVAGLVSLTTAQWTSAIVGAPAGGLIAGEIYYVAGPTEAGKITNIKPGADASAAAARPVGIALSPTNIQLYIVPVNDWADELFTSITTLSDLVSANFEVVFFSIGALNVQVGLLSEQVSVLSQAVSVLSQAVSAVVNTASNALSIANVVSARLASVIANELSAHSQAISVHSQQISVLSQAVSAKAPWLQAIARVVSNTQSINVSTMTGVSGLSITLGAGQEWHFHGMLWVSTSAVGAGLRVGTSVAGGLAAAPRFMRVEAAGGPAANVQSAAALHAYGLVATSGTTVLMSLTSAGGAAGVGFPVRLEGMILASAAGSFQIAAAGIASTAASPLHVMAGSYIFAYRIV